MRVSAINYLLLGVAVFAAFFGIQALIVPHYLPTPTAEYLSHPLEVTGTYTYFKGSRAQSTVWVNNKPFYCGAGAFGYYTCVGYINGLPQRSSITLLFVNLKTIYGTIPVAMSVKSSGTEFFSQTPVQCINAWRNENIFWFSAFSLIIAILVVGFTYILLTQDKMA